MAVIILEPQASEDHFIPSESEDLEKQKALSGVVHYPCLCLTISKAVV